MMTFERMRILLIEDQDEMRSMIHCMLTDMGFTNVIEAGDGITALDLLLKNPEDCGFDVVLCDWNLPTMEGIEIARNIRNHHLDLPVLMITGRNDQKSILQAKEAGITAYIHKPFNMKQLEEKLRALYAQFYLMPPSSRISSL